MSKVNAGKMSVSVMPTVIAGAIVNGKANYLTLGACGLMSINPPLLYISVNKAHYTNTGIKEQGWFSVNIPSRDLVTKTDYVGLVSGRDTDKSGVFTAFYGKASGVPMIEECPVNMLCKVYKEVDLPSNDLFIGEVMETYVEEKLMTGGRPDLKKIDPLILGGASYWALGDVVGAAFKDGQALIKKGKNKRL
jgi:flavin reductase (DIM6/NTAB) family NADH-FMN oxidoreductase RutF